MLKNNVECEHLVIMPIWSSSGSLEQNEGTDSMTEIDRYNYGFLNKYS